jgi:hypothetical protein
MQWWLSLHTLLEDVHKMHTKKQTREAQGEGKQEGG